MNTNFIDDLIAAVGRVVTPNANLLREILVIGGMPEPTQNLRYLSYNRHSALERNRCCEFSAVATINNRRAAYWRLTGYSKTVSRWVFSTRWTRNPLDLFLNNLRCDGAVVDVLAGAAAHYSLLGILTVTERCSPRTLERQDQYISPVVAIPGITGSHLKTIQAFEAANQIKDSPMIGIRLFRKTGRQMVIG